MDHDDFPQDHEILALHQLVQGQSLLQSLESYWRELRGAQRLPVRSAVDPTRIDAVLPHAFIAERISPRVARLRVSGQRINDLIGADGRGMPLSVLFAADSRDILADHLQAAFDRPAIVELPLYAPRSLTRGRLSGRLLMLPLAGADGQVTRILGAALIDGRIGFGARALQIPPAGAIRLDDIAPPLGTAPLRAVAGSSHPATSPAQARPALRLVVSND